jgi:peptidoglycan/LPS O-acetylase OafA/YrhL
MKRDSSVLDSLRAVAVSLVLVDHLAETFGSNALIPIRVAWHLGRLGVILFFVHTSYVLMLSMQRRGQTGAALFRDFYVRRAFRIYPLALATIAAMVLFDIPRRPWEDARTVLTIPIVLSNVLLAQNLTGSPSILSLMWSLSAEVLFYAVLPFLFVATRAGSSVSRLAVLWGLAVAAAVLQEAAQTSYLSVLYYAPCFTSGVVAFVVTEKTAGGRWPFWAWAATLAGSVAAYLGISALATEVHISPLAWSLCLLLGVLLPNFSETSATAVKSVSHVIAKYSYGIYLAHMPAMWVGFRALGDHSAIVQWTTFGGLLVVLSVTAYHAIEAPFIRVGHSVANALAWERAPQPTATVSQV